MELSVTLFGLAPDQYVPVVRHAEACGFSSVWLADHLLTPLDFAPDYPYNPTGRPSYSSDTPLVDILVLAGHLAAVTSTIRIGTGVYILPLRSPFVTARAVATVQDLSDGRFLFGVGTGWMREEFDAVGERFDGRGARTEEIVEILRLLWTGNPVRYDGRDYRFEPVRLAPRPVRRIPLLFGGTTDVALDRAARLGDGWFAPKLPLADALAVGGRLRALREKAGRADQDFQDWYRLDGPLAADTIERHRAAGVDRLVLSASAAGRREGASAGAASTDGILAGLERAARLGLD